MEVINNDKVFNTFANLWERWQDEKDYEDINDYAKVLAGSITKNTSFQPTNVTATKRPFGIKFTTQDGEKYHVFCKMKNSTTLAFYAKKSA